MSNEITLYKPSELVTKLPELTKIRDLESAERLSVAHKVVSDLLLLCGVNGEKADPKHHVRAIQFISQVLGDYAPEEIVFAFNLAIAGHIKVELFQQINSLVIGRVMREYNRWKQDKKPKKSVIDRITKDELGYDKEKFGILEIADRMQKELDTHAIIEHLSDDYMTFYIYLHKSKNLPRHDESFKNKYMDLARPLSNKKVMELYQKGEISKGQMAKELQSIAENKSDQFKQEIIKLILKDKWIKLASESKTFTDVV